MFIDNLPNDEAGLKSMLKNVRKHIVELEKQFFIEENSDSESTVARDDAQEQLVLSLKKQRQNNLR